MKIQISLDSKILSHWVKYITLLSNLPFLSDDHKLTVVLQNKNILLKAF